MYWEDVTRLSRYWQQVPPVRDLVAIIAQALGAKLGEPQAPTGSDAIELPPEFEE